MNGRDPWSFHQFVVRILMFGLAVSGTSAEAGNVISSIQASSEFRRQEDNSPADLEEEVGSDVFRRTMAKKLNIPVTQLQSLKVTIEYIHEGYKLGGVMSFSVDYDPKGLSEEHAGKIMKFIEGYLRLRCLGLRKANAWQSVFGRLKVSTEG